MKSTNIQYYVEGDDEKKLISVLKSEMRVIRPGKVQKLNVIQEQISQRMLRTYSQGTAVVLIFDTDTTFLDILNKNIKILKECRAVSEVILVLQVPNLEGELVRSCDIKAITELLNSRSAKEFKSDLIRISNLANKLREHKFDIKLFWAQKPKDPYQNYVNDAEKIKLD